MMNYTYAYPRPMVTVDIALLIQKNAPQILLIQRKNDPFKDTWALPGGFVDEMEDLEAAALRELQEETSVQLQQLKQFYTYGTPGRDPRGHTISIVFYQWLQEKPKALAADDAKALAWYSMNDLPPLAFDHATILEDIKKAIS